MAGHGPSSPSREEYTVGWISALAIESAAAAEMLDVEYPTPSVPIGDTNNYLLGKIGPHNIVMACIHEAGGLPAHVVATHLMTSFPNVRHVLMVGIGGGIPSDQYPIRLGDVVVSEPTQRSAGVVQSDFGKWEEDGFKVTGSLNRPAESLIRATGAMKRNHLRNRSQIHRFVRHFAGNVLSPELWRYQGRENDSLHIQDTELRHVSLCTECKDQLVEYAPDPRVHYGIIASGNQVVKNREQRDRIQEQLGACCVEMEAFGLMNHFPCLVIRGISDYADEGKNDRWQQYAALTAAAYGKELLMQLSPVQHAPSMSEQLEKISNEIHEIRSEMGASQRLYDDTASLFETFTRDHQADRIFKWLSPPDPSSSYSEAKEKRCEGTGSWFFNGRTFQKWTSGLCRGLWLYAMPGCGKTVLSSMIIEQLQHQQDSTHVTLFFFFDFKKGNQQSSNDMLRSLVWQLYIRQKHCRSDLNALYASCHGQQPTTASLADTFRQTIHSLERVFLVIDAVDESMTQRGLLALLKDLSKISNMHYIATSRREKEIDSNLKTWIPAENIMDIPTKETNADIDSYVRKRLQEDIEFDRWRTEPLVQEEIIQGIMHKAGSMFRWAACQLDRLGRCLHLRALRQVLATMPDTLEETYEQILISTKEHRYDAIRILQFLAFSNQPLTIREMGDAMVVDLYSDPPFNPELRLRKPEEIIDICPSLISVTSKQDGNRLQLAHLSVKEYLLSGPLPAEFYDYFDEYYARACIANVCLAYLLHLDTETTVDMIEQIFPLARYAARHWMEHARIAEEDSYVQKNIFRLFANTPKYTIWRSLFNPETPWIQDETFLIPDPIFPLYDACIGGLGLTVDTLLEEGADVNFRHGMYGTVLQAASCKGHVNIVETLLQNGADMRAPQSGIYGSALHAAVAENHEPVVRLLVSHGADINLMIGHFGTVLQVASAAGYDRTVNFLLNHGANINVVGGRYGTALQAAAFEGHEAVVATLLGRRANIHTRGRIFGSHLQTSARSYSRYAYGGYYTTSNQNYTFNNDYTWERNGVQDSPGRGSPLQAACFKGHEGIVRLLLRYGADIDAPGGEFGTAFQAATAQGHQHIIEILSNWRLRPTQGAQSDRRQRQNTDGEQTDFPDVSQSSYRGHRYGGRDGLFHEE